jgi:hypothetical protein
MIFGLYGEPVRRLLLFTGEPDITNVLFEALDTRAEVAMGVRTEDPALGEEMEV